MAGRGRSWAGGRREEEGHGRTTRPPPMPMLRLVRSCGRESGRRRTGRTGGEISLGSTEQRTMEARGEQTHVLAERALDRCNGRHAWSCGRRGAVGGESDLAATKQVVGSLAASVLSPLARAVCLHRSALHSKVLLKHAREEAIAQEVSSPRPPPHLALSRRPSLLSCSQPSQIRTRASLRSCSLQRATLQSRCAFLAKACTLTSRSSLSCSPLEQPKARSTRAR